MSAASVSAIVGYTVPTASPFTDHIKPTKANSGISAVVSTCTYGTETFAALAKTVVLSLEVTSRPITGAELKTLLAQAQKLKMKLTSYHGLGMTAYTLTEGGSRPRR